MTILVQIQIQRPLEKIIKEKITEVNGYIFKGSNLIVFKFASLPKEGHLLMETVILIRAYSLL